MPLPYRPGATSDFSQDVGDSTFDDLIAAPRAPSLILEMGRSMSSRTASAGETQAARSSDLPQDAESPRRPQRTFIGLQHWEGAIVALNAAEEEFSAVLRDLTDPSRPEEQADFPFAQVPPADVAFIVVGAIFYWSIGYEDNQTGGRRTVSIIRFRRLPKWTYGDMRRIELATRRLRGIFGID